MRRRDHHMSRASFASRVSTRLAPTKRKLLNVAREQHLLCVLREKSRDELTSSS
jgi:hypothetical protein